jgi:putative spermidine/putrescine transport system permease protein
LTEGGRTEPGGRVTAPRVLMRARRRPRVGRTVTLLVAAIYFIGPLGVAFWFSIHDRLHGGVRFNEYTGVLSVPGLMDAFTMSLKLAVATIVILLVLLVPTMLLVQLRLPRFRPIMETLCLMPLVVPPVVLAAGIFAVLGSGPLTSGPLASVGSDLQQTSMPWILAFEYVILTMPFSYRAIDAGMRSIDLATLVEAARNLGAGWPTLTLRVLLPPLRTALLNAGFLAFALVLGEYTLATILQYTVFSVWIVTAGQTDGQLQTALSIMSLGLTWVLLILIGLLAGSRRGKSRLTLRRKAR